VSFSRLLHGLNPAEEQKLQFRIGFAETELDRSFETLFKSMCLGERAQSTVRACLTYRLTISCKIWFGFKVKHDYI